MFYLKTTLFRCITGLESYNGEIISEDTTIEKSFRFAIDRPILFLKNYRKRVYKAYFLMMEQEKGSISTR